MIFEEKKFNPLAGLPFKEGKMLTCPHCQGRGLRHLFNVFMGSFGSVTCHLCGHSFGVTAKVKILAQCLCYCTGLLALVLALTMNSAWPLIVYAAILLQLFVLAMFRFDLVVLKDEHLDLVKSPIDNESLRNKYSDKDI